MTYTIRGPGWDAPPIAFKVAGHCIELWVETKPPVGFGRTEKHTLIASWVAGSSYVEIRHCGDLRPNDLGLVAEGMAAFAKRIENACPKCHSTGRRQLCRNDAAMPADAELIAHSEEVAGFAHVSIEVRCECEGQ